MTSTTPRPPASSGKQALKTCLKRKRGASCWILYDGGFFFFRGWGWFLVFDVTLL